MDFLNQEETNILKDKGCFLRSISVLSDLDLHLTLSQTTNFRLFQTQSVCRQQFHIRMKMAESFPYG